MTTASATRQELRRRLLAATLPHVPFDGWTRASIDAGAADAGMAAGEARRLFPEGAGEMVSFFLAEGDRAMLDELSEINLADMRVRDRIATAVRIRLEVDGKHREAVLRAAAMKTGPSGARALWRTVDAIWHAAGDTATDFNYYTKRLLLAGVHSATLLCWLNDDSPGRETTWAFLDRRIADVMTISTLKARLPRLRPGPIARFAMSRSPLSGCRPDR
ncbi:MAG: COQ9 family protein [bacterium]|nr:COQ9 family protein [bacterium]